MRGLASRSGWMIALSVAFALGCTRPSPPPPDALRQLYLELEQNHSRSKDRFGYSLTYAAESPNTIAILLHYDPATEAGVRGKDVAEKAQQFVRNLAREKYGLNDLQIRSENIRQSE